MYKFKRFSKSKSDEAENKRSTPKDANTMTALGKTGLQEGGSRRVTNIKKDTV